MVARDDLDKLHQLVQLKAETVKVLEALLEKEETELVELECQLEALEDKRRRSDHPRF